MCIKKILAGSKYLSTVLLLSNVSVRWYAVITPFLRASSGGSHVMITDKELCTSITTFDGLPVGATMVIIYIYIYSGCQ